MTSTVIICYLIDNIVVTNASARVFSDGSGSGTTGISTNISVLEGIQYVVITVLLFEWHYR